MAGGGGFWELLVSPALLFALATIPLLSATAQGVWEIVTVDNIVFGGCFTSIALDSFDRPHISYYDASNRDLKYAHYDGMVWHVEAVDSVGRIGEHTSIALDSFDRPHISYYDASNRDLKYAHYDGMVWHVEAVDSVGRVGEHTSIALDSFDRPHVSYYDWTNRNLKNAHCLRFLPDDVNMDGVVDSQDVRLILQAICGFIVLTPEQEEIADVNGDNQVTWEDAEIVAGRLIGE